MDRERRSEEHAKHLNKEPSRVKGLLLWASMKARLPRISRAR